MESLCCSNWSNYTLKNQLRIYAFATIIGAMLTIQLISIIFVSVNNNKIQDYSEKSLLSQGRQNIHSVVNNGAELLNIRIKRSVENFVNPIAIASEDTTRPDYPYNITTSYFGWPGYINQPNFNLKYHSDISMTHSSYNVYNYSPFNISQANDALKYSIYSTASIDPIFVQVYNNSPIYISGYTGLSDQGFFREYPGISNPDVSKLIAYDPRQEDWYIDAIKTPGSYVFTLPYFDKYVNSWMMTISRSIKNPVSGEIIGVTGGDITISELTDAVKNIKYDNSITLLLDGTSGMVIARSDKSLNDTQYYNQTGLGFTAEDWHKISIQNMQLINNDKYNVFSSKLYPFDNEYVLVMFVPTEVVYSAYNKQITDLDTIIKQYWTVTICLFFVIVFIVMAINTKIIDYVVGPIQELISGANKITANMGRDDLYKDVKLEQKAGNIDEARDLHNHFAHVVQKAHEHKSNENAPNPYYVPQSVQMMPQQQAMYLQPVVIHPVPVGNWVGQQPNAPPNYNDSA
jgi:hypothetical protein